MAFIHPLSLRRRPTATYGLASIMQLHLGSIERVTTLLSLRRLSSTANLIYTRPTRKIILALRPGQHQDTVNAEDHTSPATRPSIIPSIALFPSYETIEVVGLMRLQSRTQMEEKALAKVIIKAVKRRILGTAESKGGVHL